MGLLQEVIAEKGGDTCFVARISEVEGEGGCAGYIRDGASDGEID